MPYKDKEKEKDSAKLRMQKYRQKGVTKGVTESPQNVTPFKQNVTPKAVTPVTPSNKILHGLEGRAILVDIEKAAKLLMICESLRRHSKSTNLLKEVRFGIFGLTMDEIYKQLI